VCVGVWVCVCVCVCVMWYVVFKQKCYLVVSEGVEECFQVLSCTKGFLFVVKVQSVEPYPNKSCVERGRG
jgi:hypothetical protein